MRNLSRQLSQVLLVSAGAGLAACGGGGSSGTGVDGLGAIVVKGVAATGKAIPNGQVTFRCVSGTTHAVSTQTDGSYAVDVSTATLPCVARVDFRDAGGNTQRLHSLVKAPGIVNITPLTDMVVANLSSSGIAADTFDKFQAAEVAGYTDDRVYTATQIVKTRLTVLGVTTVSSLPADLIGGELSAAHDGKRGDDHDRVLDELESELEGKRKTLQQVEHEMHSDDDDHASTSTGHLGDAAAGQVAYQAMCQGCHGAKISDARNAGKILEAIRENEGGMGSLAGAVTTTMADNIATYMTTGVTGGSAPTLITQSINFGSPGNQTMGVATPPLVAVASSGLPVTISSNTTAVCTVAGSVLTLLAPGNCSLSASQSGNSAYSAAVTVTRSFNVAAPGGTVLQGQTIIFASPGAQTVGSPVALTASADSGLLVTFSSTTPTVCTISGTTLNLLAGGNCTITANQPGNSSFAAAAPVSRTFAVTDPGSTPSAANGQTLYSSNCSICHGPAASGNMKVLTGANSPSTIQNAIGRNAGGMGSLSGLSSQSLADIAAYLANPI